MTSQQTIGHYRITSELSACRTRLALIAAASIAAHRRAALHQHRFTREAQVLASLNHPNIAHIYGVEDRALITELVEGAELKGPLPESEALPVIHQLIDALECAHENGIVHRDLKPANIKVTPEGKVKVHPHCWVDIQGC